VDGDFSNGQTETLLHDFDTLVLGNQDETAYTITYHPTLLDAENNTAELPEPYYNLTPFTETIFTRIENNLNTNCFDTTSFDIIINPIPTALNSALLRCDEYGMSDGSTAFNLTDTHTATTGWT